MAKLRSRIGQEGPGPWFTAAFDGECSREGDEIEEGDVIRADGEGGWEHQDCVQAEERGLAEADAEGRGWDASDFGS